MSAYPTYMEPPAVPGVARTPALARALLAILLTYVAFKLALLLGLAVNAQYLMDEYALANSVKQLDGALYRDSWPNRTVLYAVYYRAAFWLGADSVEVMRLARLQSFVLALASLGVVYGISRTLGRDRLESILALAVALSVSSFMERLAVTLTVTMLLFWPLDTRRLCEPRDMPCGG